jgi:hypothetical protein
MDGKQKLVISLGAKNFKILPVAAAAGSEHPIVPSSAPEGYLEKLRNHRKATKGDSSDEEVDLMEPLLTAEEVFKNNLHQWTISNDPNVLLGPEQILARNIEDNSLVAVAIKDIFD